MYELTDKVFVIAEIGVNHNGEIDTALEMTERAAAAGANAVKFQTFNSSALVTPGAEIARYQRENIGSTQDQLSMLCELELEQSDYSLLKTRCLDTGVEFMSTAFDFGSLDFLVHELGVERLKVGSGEITNGPFLLAHARTGCSIVLSTGMANDEDVSRALGILAFGFLEGGVPDQHKIQEAFKSKEGRAVLRNKVTLLQCTTQYPAPLDNANLRAMVSMRKQYKVNVGYSDHTLGTTASLVAVSLGATIIEKHFTLDRSLPGPDHKASAEPQEFQELVSAIRNVEACLGDGIKSVQSSERENIGIARKSIVAATAIRKGDLLTPSNLTFMRPGYGLSPMEYWDILGTAAEMTFQKGDLITRS